MHPFLDADRPEPVTVAEAARRADRKPGTVYSWATRYGVRKWSEAGRTYLDWQDLAVIERCIRLGEPVPATAEKRDELRLSPA